MAMPQINAVNNIHSNKGDIIQKTLLEEES